MTECSVRFLARFPTPYHPLGTFPNAKLLEEGQRVTDSVSKQSNAMVTFVRDLNAKSHVPLVDQVLPIAISAERDPGRARATPYIASGARTPRIAKPCARVFRTASISCSVRVG